MGKKMLKKKGHPLAKPLGVGHNFYYVVCDMISLFYFYFYFLIGIWYH